MDSVLRLLFAGHEFDHLKELCEKLGIDTDDEEAWAERLKELLVRSLKTVRHIPD